MVAEKSTLNPHFGAHGEEEIPVLIPNTEVKLFSGDYTATSGKLARRRIIKKPSEQGGFFLIRDSVISHLQQCNPGRLSTNEMSVKVQLGLSFTE
ncbi:MAG: hypothetical protein QG649_52 [Patescibacteria group bacterium]|nr:hypothetical protein [Patescibacteria group bacterium]